jgi:hypothetical protein
MSMNQSSNPLVPYEAYIYQSDHSIGSANSHFPSSVISNMGTPQMISDYTSEFAATCNGDMSELMRGIVPWIFLL